MAMQTPERFFDLLELNFFSKSPTQTYPKLDLDHLRPKYDMFYTYLGGIIVFTSKNIAFQGN